MGFRSSIDPGVSRGLFPGHSATLIENLFLRVQAKDLAWTCMVICKCRNVVGSVSRRKNSKPRHYLHPIPYHTAPHHMLGLFGYGTSLSRCMMQLQLRHKLYRNQSSPYSDNTPPPLLLPPRLYHHYSTTPALNVGVCCSFVIKESEAKSADPPSYANKSSPRARHSRCAACWGSGDDRRLCD